MTDTPADCIEETRTRSAVKTAVSSAVGIGIYFAAASCITTNHRQSVAMLFLAAADGLLKTGATYIYERKISRLSSGRNAGADRDKNPARDRFGRSALAAVGECVLSGSTDIIVTAIATHDPLKALLFMAYRTPGRMGTSVILKRLWAYCNWGVKVKLPIAANDNKTLFAPVSEPARPLAELPELALEPSLD